MTHHDPSLAGGRPVVYSVVDHGFAGPALLIVLDVSPPHALGQDHVCTVAWLDQAGITGCIARWQRNVRSPDL